MVDSEKVEDYRPPREFVEDSRKELTDINFTDSTEIWFLRSPLDINFAEFDGQELSLKLNSDGTLASFKDSSGKEYNLVSFSSQEPDETVFLASPTKPKIVGKISRRVSFVHYPDPKEFQETKSTRKGHIHSSGSKMTTSSRYFPMQSSYGVSSKGSRKSSLSQFSEPPNGHSTGVSGVSSLSSDHSHGGGKSKRRKHKQSFLTSSSQSHPLDV